jgi:hypothetical protein
MRRGEIAALLGIDPNNASFTQKLKLDRAVSLRLELDRMQAAQAAGQSVDIGRLTAAAEALVLEALVPSDASACDLSRLSDDEVSILERIAAKATGAEPVGDVIEIFRVEFINAKAKDDDKIAQLTAEVESQRSEIARLRDRLYCAHGPDIA